MLNRFVKSAIATTIALAATVSISSCATEAQPDGIEASIPNSSLNTEADLKKVADLDDNEVYRFTSKDENGNPTQCFVTLSDFDGSSSISCLPLESDK
jgi:hypothetical protein